MATAITTGRKDPSRRCLRVSPAQPPRQTGRLNLVSMLASLGSERHSDSSIRASARRSAGARLMRIPVRQPALTRARRWLS
jgi:hypothetical protein